jgi:hypothetical protein
MQKHIKLPSHQELPQINEGFWWQWLGEDISLLNASINILHRDLVGLEMGHKPVQFDVVYYNTNTKSSGSSCYHGGQLKPEHM